MNSRELVKSSGYPAELEQPRESFPSLDYDLDSNSTVQKGVYDYLLAIRRHLWLIVGLTVISTVFTAIYMARKPDIYEVEARVLIDYESNPAISGTSSTAVILNSPVSDPAYISTLQQVMTGPGLLRRVVKTLDLENNPDFKNPKSLRERSVWRRMGAAFGLGEDPPEEKPQEDRDVLFSGQVAPATASEDLKEARRLAPYVSSIHGDLSVAQVQTTRLIGIYYEHPDPQIAAKVVNAIADTFVLSNLEKMTETNVSSAAFLKRRVAELQSLIRRDEERLINYAKSNQMLSLEPGQNTVVDRLVGLNSQLLGAENERKTAEANYRAALAPGVAEALVPGAGVPTPEESKVLELKQRRAQLLVENTEEWPEVQQIDRQIAVLEKQIAEGNNRSKTVTIVNLETKYRQALAREQALREAFQKQRSETVTQNEAAINYRIIQQETATNKALLNSLLQRYKENDLILAGTANNIRVSDYALAPSSPTGPKRLQIVALAFIVSLAVGLALAIGLGYLDNTMRSAADVERHLGLPALAVIPAIENGATRPPLLGRFNLVPFNKQNGNGHQRPLLLNGDIHSPMAEVYRKLRTSVLLFGKRPPKTVLVTSSLPSEGKTTTAINTALVLSRPEAKVLLIDADMRQPSVHHIFGIPNEGGLSDILSGDMTEEEINSLIIRDEVSGLYILPAGPAAVNPAELLTSERMLYLLVTLGSSFGHIVVDSPPIAPFTDSVLIALLVDGVLLVVEGGKSSLDVVQSSQRVLEDVGSKILGVVLNKVDMPATNHYYQYYQRVQA